MLEEVFPRSGQRRRWIVRSHRFILSFSQTVLFQSEGFHYLGWAETDREPETRNMLRKKHNDSGVEPREWLFARLGQLILFEGEA